MINEATTTGRAGADSIDDRLITQMRFILALLALLIIYFDPSEPDRYVPVTYTTLILYTVYSAALYIIAISRKQFFRIFIEWSHWIDVVWYLWLIALSSGTNSIFFFFFFFSILIASFRFGFASGLMVTISSAVLFTVIGYATSPDGVPVELNRFLLRPVYLLVLGYMMAYWGGREITSKRRLALLKDVSIFSNPRFGVQRTVMILVEHLRAFYDADSCLLVLFDSGEYTLYRASFKDTENVVNARIIEPEPARQLLALPEHQAVIYGRKVYPWYPMMKSYLAYDVTASKREADGKETSRIISTLLDAASFIAVPLSHHKEVIGRIYVTTKMRRAFDITDLEFLIQVFDHVMPVIENIRLVDHLASSAAEEERQRIARNVHDSVIQPYLGLQIGLGTVRDNLATAITNGAPKPEQMNETVIKMIARLDQLIEMTNLGISDLRSYITGLRGTGERDSSLLPAIRRFAQRFAEATGIDVQVETDGDGYINDRLAAEIFQMVVEGMSNIRRHTRAEQAIIHLSWHSGYLILRIENDEAPGSASVEFMPLSISGRAESLGGRVQVMRNKDHRTVVTVAIPL